MNLLFGQNLTKAEATVYWFLHGRKADLYPHHPNCRCVTKFYTGKDPVLTINGQPIVPMEEATFRVDNRIISESEHQAQKTKVQLSMRCYSDN